MTLEKDGLPEDTGSPRYLEIRSNSIIQRDTKALVSPEVTQRFHALFSGCEHAYGTYNNIDFDKRRDDGKFKGQAITKREPVTHRLWADHLAGISGLGIIPIRDDNTVMFGAIDIDAYEDLDHGRIAGALAKFGYPLVTCRSKSGGAHLYCFSMEPVPAVEMQKRLQEIAARLGHGTAEIFPKQSVIRVEKQDLGSWINCPYFNAADTIRYAIRATGDAMTADEFLDTAEAAKQPAGWFADALPRNTDALPNGPPCLQHLMELGFPPGTWNCGMFNLGVYCRKAHPDGWKGHLIQLNAKNFPPDKWPMSDLEEIMKSLTKKEYFYQCGKQPLVQHCDRVTCRKRKFGVGGANSLPVLSSLTKLLTDPPLWFVEIDGHRLELTTEALLNPIQFQIKCADHNVIVPLVKRSVWTEHLRAPMEGVQEIPVSDDSGIDDSSSKGHFLELFEQFCLDRSQARTLEEVRLGKPYTGDNGVTQFRLSDLMVFLARKNFKDLRRHNVVSILKDQGATNRQVKFQGGRVLRLWSVPSFGRVDGPLPLPEEILDQGRF